MILYISGPMTGIEGMNYQAFHDAKERLKKVRFDVISPADLPIDESKTWSDYMDLNIKSVFQAHGIALLDGWENSKGSRVEVAIARVRGMPIRTVEQWVGGGQ